MKPIESNKPKTAIITARIKNLELGVEPDCRCTVTRCKIELDDTPQVADWDLVYKRTFNLPANKDTRNRAEALSSQILSLCWLFGRCSIGSPTGELVRAEVVYDRENRARIIAIGHIIDERWVGRECVKSSDITNSVYDYDWYRLSKESEVAAKPKARANKKTP